MDNKKTGRFIAERRKEMNLSQKQLAERLNVTDKAVSKWETGNGAPDISLLTVIADSLNITVVELLDGQFSDKTNAQAQTEKIVVEALQKAKKERIKTAISILIVLVIIFSLVNVAVYGYWGRRHKILYNIDTVYVHQDTENSKIYDFYYNCTVKNWWFDFNEYTYNLVADLGGEPGSWHFISEADEITSNNLDKTSFVIHVKFDMSTVSEPVPPLEEIIMMARFSAYDVNGEHEPRANLYMSDFADAMIVTI